MTAGKVKSKLNKIACKQKVEAAGQRSLLIKAFHNAQLAEDDVDFVIDKIQSCGI